MWIQRCKLDKSHFNDKFNFYLTVRVQWTGCDINYKPELELGHQEQESVGKNSRLKYPNIIDVGINRFKI